MAPKIAFLAAALASCAVHAEPICWNDGSWDVSGAPKGVLLSDNEGWWGRCVFTGVTYSYEAGPTSPKDVLGGDKTLFGRLRNPRLWRFLISSDRACFAR